MIPQDDLNSLSKTLLDLKDKTRKEFIEIGAELIYLTERLERAEKDFYKA